MRASTELRPGDPHANRALLGISPAEYRLPTAPIQDTTTCLVADRWGNVVAATPSGWGGVMAGETGILLGSRLRSLNTWPGHPNCIEPGKRPRITLTPTLVFRAGQPVAAISVAGGDQQDQVTLQLLLSHLEFGFDPARGGDGAAFRHGPLGRLVQPDAAPIGKPDPGRILPCRRGCGPPATGPPSDAETSPAGAPGDARYRPPVWLENRRRGSGSPPPCTGVLAFISVRPSISAEQSLWRDTIRLRCWLGTCVNSSL